ncbi:MAG: Ger(x)C family spore germination protein [Peptococcaceae bacterium]|nr:Ger(x)C family spore germination protein [Peptococcaceae bacterium]
MNRVVFIFLLVVLSALHCGCWDRVEIDDLELVIGDAHDLADYAGKTGVQTTFQIANPQAMISSQGAMSGGRGGGEGGGSGSGTFFVVSERGESIRDSVAKMNYRIPKQLFLGHERVAIFGEKAARSGLTPFFDRLTRSRESRDTKFIAVSKGNASRILEQESPVSQSTAQALNTIFENKDGWQGILAVNMADFLYRLGTGVTSPVAPLVEVVPQTSMTSKEKKEGLSNTVALTGLAVFDTHGRLVDTFNERETMGLMWVINRVKNRALTIPHVAEGKAEPVSLDLTKAKGKIKVDIEDNGLPVFEIKMQTEFDLLEHFSKHREMIDVGLIAELEKTASTQVINEIEAVLKKSQMLGTDVFGFGEEVRRQHRRNWPQYKEHWRDVFPIVNVAIQCETRIHNRELSVEPPGSRTEGEWR